MQGRCFKSELINNLQQAYAPKNESEKAKECVYAPLNIFRGKAIEFMEIN